MTVRITLRDDGVDRALAGLAGRLRQPRMLMADLGEALLTSTRNRFQQQIDPDGRPWHPLSPAYARWKKKRGRSSKILQLNGYLFGGLTYQASDDRVEIGSNRVYAAIHQFGGQVFAGQRAGHVRLRTDQKGNLVKRGNLASFAGRKHKLYAVRTYATKYHEVNIPARPFLGISDSDRAEIGRIVARYLIGS